MHIAYKSIMILISRLIHTGTVIPRLQSVSIGLKLRILGDGGLSVGKIEFGRMLLQ
jgi:hypothetical protein